MERHVKTCEEHLCLKNFLWQKKKVPWKNLPLQLPECNLERNAISEAFLCLTLAVYKSLDFFFLKLSQYFKYFSILSLIVSAQLKKIMLETS